MILAEWFLSKPQHLPPQNDLEALNGFLPCAYHRFAYLDEYTTEGGVDPQGEGPEALACGPGYPRLPQREKLDKGYRIDGMSEQKIAM